VNSNAEITLKIMRKVKDFLYKKESYKKKLKIIMPEADPPLAEKSKVIPTNRDPDNFVFNIKIGESFNKKFKIL